MAEESIRKPMDVTPTIYNREVLEKLFNGSDEGRRHVHFFAAIPNDLIPYLPGFWWDQRRLFALQLESELRTVSDLDHLLDVPIWRATARSSLFTIRGREILQDPGKYPDHWRRIQAADISYPIILYKRDRYILLLDGYHRLLKSIYECHSHIHASFVTNERIDDILITDGLLGELNLASRDNPEFIVHARTVARDLLTSDKADQYPAWT